MKLSSKILVGLSATAVAAVMSSTPVFAVDKGEPTAITADCTDAIGNSVATAAQLSNNTSVEEPIDCSGDTDYWKFTLANTSSIQIQLSQLPSDYDLHVVRSDGSILAVGTRAGSASEDVQATLFAGSYYIKVYPYSYSDANAAVKYRLSLGVTETGSNSDHAGNTPNEATPLPDSGVVNEAIDSNSDLDYWKFNVDEASDVNLKLTNLPADYDLYVYAPQANGQLQQIGLGYNGGRSSEDVTVLNLATGSYLALVRPYSGAVPDVQYKLAVTKTKRPTQPAPSPTPTPTPSEPAPAPTNPCAASVDGQGATWVVATDGSVKKADVAAAGGENITKLGAIDTFVTNLTPSEATALAHDDGVVAVERNKRVELDATQNNATWGLDRVDQTSLPLNGSYTYPGAGEGVNAYIIDTGVRATHNELQGRVNTGYSAFGGTSNDDQGHGTHVAGTVAGTTYGVAKSAVIIPVKVLDSSGSGCTNSVVTGLNWVASNHLNGQPAVANMSLGGGASTAIDLAVEQVVADGVTVAVAAGNSGDDACYYSPARATNAITVGATDNTDTRAYFSNYGSCVDIFAPGVGITSSTNGSDNATATWSGTSMASPHVAGAAAVYLSLHPTQTPAQVTDAMITASTKDVIHDAASANRLLIVGDYALPVPAPAPAPAQPGNAPGGNAAPANPNAGNPNASAPNANPASGPGNAANGASNRPDVLTLAKPQVAISNQDIKVTGNKLIVQVSASGATKGTKAVLQRNGKTVGRGSVDGSGHINFKNVPAKAGKYKVVIMQGSTTVSTSNTIKFTK